VREGNRGYVGKNGLGEKELKLTDHPITNFLPHESQQSLIVVVHWDQTGWMPSHGFCV
jgi:hypothetical protein